MAPMTGDDFKTRRKALGMKQSELAKRLGVHPLTVSKWERSLHAIPEMAGMALAYLEQDGRTARADAEREGER